MLAFLFEPTSSIQRLLHLLIATIQLLNLQDIHTAGSPADIGDPNELASCCPDDEIAFAAATTQW